MLSADARPAAGPQVSASWRSAEVMMVAALLGSLGPAEAVGAEGPAVGAGRACDRSWQ